MSDPHLPSRRLVPFALAAVLVFAADLVTKDLAVAHLAGQAPVRVAGGSLYLVLLHNPGAAFSLLPGQTWLLTVITAVVVLTILVFAARLRSRGWALGVGLVLGGALGNLTDRLTRPPGFGEGHVVDFLSLFAPDGSVWPVFNIADAAIVSGGVLLVLLALLGIDYDGTRTQRTARAAQTEQAPRTEATAEETA
ncbi:signal peptidase II [Crossiella equi]|uniref:Lipoprotein signal peptidase n=1 Tax=Crossiella equi TaxID=130796 RepID=A0ABS5AAQ2_9PSEU|nr:signal peptidase II [Crossiella equi]MBP2473654.1 signal peptidase II [Crossiella equi]